MRFWLKILFLILVGVPLAALSAWEPDTDEPIPQEVIQDQPAPVTVTAPDPAETAKQLDRLQQELDAVEADISKLYLRMGLPPSLGGSDRTSQPDKNVKGTQAACYAARDAYQRGDYAKAERAIDRIGHAVPPACAEGLPSFHALVLMKSGRDREAERVMSKEISADARDAWTSYNLGVAKLRQGDLLLGSGLMDRVGTMTATSEEMLALRDQANLALGYAFLRADIGATARPLFRRVRLDGPYSSRALLGLGWSELAPDGKQQKNVDAQPLRCDQYHAPETIRQNPEYVLQGRDPCSPITAVNLRLPFERDPGGKTPEERNRRALKAWQVLVERDPADPAVQEALLATAYITAQLGQRDQTIERYRQAVSAYEAQRDRLDQLTSKVRSAVLPSENSGQAWGFENSQDRIYLQETLVNPAFEAEVADYRELLAYGRKLEGMAAELDRLAPMVAPEVTPEAMPAPKDTNELESTSADVTAEPPAEKLFTGVDPLIGAIGVDSVDGGTATVTTQRTEPATSQDRATILRTRLNELRANLAETSADREFAIRGLALENLGRRRSLLETYLTRARLSLARLLDPGAPSLQPDAESGRRITP